MTTRLVEDETIYIFVNPSSGGLQGKNILDKVPRESLVRIHHINVRVLVFSITEGQSGNKPGFCDMKDKIINKSNLDMPSKRSIMTESDLMLTKEIISSHKMAMDTAKFEYFDETLKYLTKYKDMEVTQKKSQMGNKPFRVVFAGGDGTVMWGMCELRAHGIPEYAVVICPLPLGTGNDFSRMSGWGGALKVSLRWKPSFKRWVKSVIRSDVHKFDTWAIDVELEEDGQFFQYKNGQIVVVKDEDGNDLKVLKKLCCNYFSTGLESEIGLSAEKNRTKSRTLNKLMYGLASLQTAVGRHDKVCDYVESIRDESQYPAVVTNPSEHFVNNPISLIFLNIPSMASGCDFWKGANRPAVTESHLPDMHDGLMDLKQNIGDGEIELLTIEKLARYTQAKAGILAGAAKRLNRGKGPFIIHFKEGYDQYAYFQIDGENYCCLHPKVAIVRNSDQSYPIMIKNKKNKPIFGKNFFSKFQFISRRYSGETEQDMDESDSDSDEEEEQEQQDRPNAPRLPQEP